MDVKMTVNGVDIATCSARFWSITPGKRKISNSSEMLDGSATPLMLNPIFGMREYTVALHVYGTGRENIWGNVGAALKLFAEVAEVTVGSGMGNAPGFKGFNRCFTLSLVDVAHVEYGSMKSKWHTVELTCAGYEHGVEMSCAVDFGTMGPENWKDGVAATREAYIDDLAINPSVGDAQKTEAITSVHVSVAQTLKCQDDGGYFSGLAGKIYPMSADISIEGLCKNSRGRDIGALTIRASPEYVPAGPTMKPAPSGYGFQEVSINGTTGACEWTHNFTSPTMEPPNTQAVVDLPGPMRWGFRGQKVKIRITPHALAYYQAKYSIYFHYVPIFL